MSLSIAIVGLPNVGKSTLFNALVKSAQAEAKNYPFCTIDPNVGIVEVPDSRLKVLSDISLSQKTVPAIVEFVDIAGLVAGASKGEGLGNKFLANIRECDAICEVVRVFEDKNVTHVSGEINPQSDIKIIETELILKDLETIDKRLQSIDKEVRSGDKKAIKLNELIKLIKQNLDSGKSAREADLDTDDLTLIKELGLLTLKPIIYVANVSENVIARSETTKQSLIDDRLPRSMPKGARNDDFIYLSAKAEAELNELSDADKKEYLEAMGIKESGLDILIKKAYDILGLQTYYTSGEKETRAWTIKKGSTAPQAAGVIHTDFERGFIAADIIKYDDFVASHGWTNARAKGLVKTQGKDYVMSPDDVVLFKFNV